MYLKRITDRDIRGKGVVGMADTPGLSPEEMPRKGGGNTARRGYTHNE